MCTRASGTHKALGLAVDSRHKLLLGPSPLYPPRSPSCTGAAFKRCCPKPRHFNVMTRPGALQSSQNLAHELLTQETSTIMTCQPLRNSGK